ncbi:MAG: AarF/UbiB family protein [Peptococcaceae bacterium]|nr:AarF/UbiB family protein [Peptococcaceae bacterium]
MSRLSDARRSWSILRLFAGFFLELAWFKVWRRFKNEQQVQSRLHKIYSRQAVRFRETALNLQGLLIKLGQFFSTRVDVLPPEYTSELAQLQDEVPCVDFASIRSVIEAELGNINEIYQAVDADPLAAASLGQVHRGRLPGGEEVAIKVLRPGVDKIIEVDLNAFRGVMWMIKMFTDWDRTIDLDDLYKDFSSTLRDELDYAKELANLQRFTQSFAGDSKITAPAVYPQFCSAHVITMEYVTGFKITDYDSLRRAGLDFKELALTLVNAYLKQVLVDGFYHADPHPGNLFVQPDGGITFIDFGMVGRITPKDRAAIRKIIESVISGDPEIMVEGLVGLGVIRPHANLVTLRKGINLMLSEMRSVSYDELGNLHVDSLLAEMREFIYSQPFQFPSHYTFLGRAVGTLSGLAAGLDPTLNVLEMLKPYAQYVLGEENESWLGIVWDRAKVVGGSLLNIPPLLEKTLHQVRNGEVQVKTELGPLTRGIQFQAVLANRLVWAILLATAAVIRTMFVLAGHAGEAVGATYATVFFALLLLLNLRKRADKQLRSPHGNRHNNN